MYSAERAGREPVHSAPIRKVYSVHVPRNWTSERLVVLL